ncbi:hypothetical protein CLAFUW4_12353 [Fulvia fulva]|uniref:Uncharacterized protein n=1 Tax=Passalora fulva TaxID=5499 RepID=A0A9Q8PEG1_PASFU|nr:uncharacterized protein CLAFUR5_11382 [Fulvia fulva]KAK4617723.1 hypothetical protein CLAFUR4_12358 [Fulvia fulva]KAK4619272.1 hypothetical protein CLAFUR0_12369 [Fulvia fulva]UJO20955.1 hypothetical protein CLAFUR5_11382 [Fulvia fulva]WPV18376.1 hypothetical protein CLAFUW4_12353 [Fulvia fulva]WPV33592.1 hypothetical protein CLAFUW7_12360 [Fulvia fulva]
MPSEGKNIFFLTVAGIGAAAALFGTTRRFTPRANPKQFEKQHNGTPTEPEVDPKDITGK